MTSPADSSATAANSTASRVGVKMIPTPTKQPPPSYLCGA